MAANEGDGDLGTSPFFGQLSGHANLTCMSTIGAPEMDNEHKSDPPSCRGRRVALFASRV